VGVGGPASQECPNPSLNAKRVTTTTLARAEAISQMYLTSALLIGLAIMLGVVAAMYPR